MQEADNPEQAWVQLDLAVSHPLVGRGRKADLSCLQLSINVTSRGLSAFVAWQTKVRSCGHLRRSNGTKADEHCRRPAKGVAHP